MVHRAKLTGLPQRRVGLGRGPALRACLQQSSPSPAAVQWDVWRPSGAPRQVRGCRPGGGRLWPAAGLPLGAGGPGVLGPSCDGEAVLGRTGGEGAASLPKCAMYSVPACMPCRGRCTPARYRPETAPSRLKNSPVPLLPTPHPCTPRLKVVGRPLSLFFLLSWRFPRAPFAAASVWPGLGWR